MIRCCAGNLFAALNIKAVGFSNLRYFFSQFCDALSDGLLHGDRLTEHTDHSRKMRFRNRTDLKPLPKWWRALSVLISPSFAASIGIKPIQQGANAAAGQSNRAVGSPVVDINGVAIRVHRVSAGEHNVVDIAMNLVLRLRPKDPRIAARQTLFRILKVKQCQAQSV